MQVIESIGSYECLQKALEYDGYTVIDFLDQAEVQHLLDTYQSLPNDLANFGFAPSIMSRDQNYRQFVSRAIKRVFREKIEKLLTGYRLCFCSFVVKQPAHTGSEVQMHQDWSFIDESRFRAFGIWSPLMDVDEHNGCLSVVKGSHQLNTKPRGLLNDFPYGNLLPVLQQNYLTRLVMKAGQVVIYDQRLFHCSPPNKTQYERVATAGLMIPQESKLRYYHRDFQSYPPKLEIFEVDDEFYTRLIIGSRPVGLTSLGFVNCEFDPLTEEELASKLGQSKTELF